MVQYRSDDGKTAYADRNFAPYSAMHEPSQVLADNLASLTEGRRKRKTPALTTDRTLQALVADLVVARVAAGMTQEQVADSHGDAGLLTQ